jgi:hypothetical protein
MDDLRPIDVLLILSQIVLGVGYLALAWKLRRRPSVPWDAWRISTGAIPSKSGGHPDRTVAEVFGDEL